MTNVDHPGGGETRNVVILVKNGIGFGHIRRALVIAEAIRARGVLRPIVISQASSLALFRDSTVRVVNFPLLHRVASAVAEDCYISILDRVLDRLDPVAVIEDTYPDQRYRDLAALAGRQRLLIMRRLDGESFDRLRESGRLVGYQHIMIAQSLDEFLQEGHSGESLAAVLSSGKFSLAGNFCQVPTARQTADARARYAPHGEALVVVNGGAGGDQAHDGYGDRLFEACRITAGKIGSAHGRVRFVFVSGPYYAGRPLAGSSNITITRFEPNLAGLLAAAHVAVLKPGNNVLSEALLGRANLVLVPDASFMEDLDHHAARVVAAYGGKVAPPDPEAIEAAIRYGLAQPPRERRTQPNLAGIARIIDAIHASAQSPPPALASKLLFLVLRPPAGFSPAALRRILPASLTAAAILHEERAGVRPITTAQEVLTGKVTGASIVMIDQSLLDADPQSLADRGVRLLLSETSSVAPAVQRWLRLRPARPALLCAASVAIQAVAGRERLFEQQIADKLNTRSALCSVVSLPETGDEPSTARYLRTIGDWLAAQPIRLASPETLIATGALRLLEPV